MEIQEETNESIELVQAIANGDKGSEEKFVRQYRAAVVSHLQRMTHDRARAEDLTHEALIIVLKKMRKDQVKEPRKLANYLFQTAKYCYFSWLRKMDNQVELRDQFDNLSHEDSDVEGQQLNQQRDELLYNSIDRLTTPRDREILLRQYVHDQSIAEICDALYLTTDSYYRIISRARFRLKENVSRFSDVRAFG